MTTHSERMPMIDQVRLRESVVLGLGLLFVLVFSFLLDLVTGGGQWPQEPAERAAIIQASTQSRGYMVYVFTERNCPFCKALRPAISRAIREGYPISEMDIESPYGALAVRQLKLTKVPTVAVFDPDPQDPRQLKFRQTSEPRVVLNDNELRQLFRLENIQPRPLRIGGPE